VRVGTVRCPLAAGGVSFVTTRPLPAAPCWWSRSGQRS